MITADPHSKLGYVCRMVASMKPGECLDLDRYDLMDIPGFEHNGARFTPADRVLENIVGSAYTHNYREHPNGRTITFIRFEDTGARHYTSPDHR